ncbi:MAG: hypothetical protein AB2401_05930 [Bacillus sp. (in: firmicutes)]
MNIKRWIISVCITVSLTIVLMGFFSPEKSYAATGYRLQTWEKVNQLLPKYSKFTVIDLETGQKFRVQRRAGSRHADVQPLTSGDTKIMKKIYHGKWSWRRRAILVVDGKKKIPASMHGMPHGAGALQNNFPGHFCIHFYGSTTHRTNHMDLSHKLMILKAAGRLEEHLAKPNPYEVVNAFIAGLKEQDETLVSLVALQKMNWLDLLGKIEAVRISNMTVLPLEDLSSEINLSIPIHVDLYIKDQGLKQFRGNIEVVRFSQFDAWKVDCTEFLNKNGLTSS